MACISYNHVDNIIRVSLVKNNYNIINVTGVLIDQERYICPNLCGRSSKNPKYLEYHLRHECGVKFSCHLCSKTFNQKSHLKRHLILIHRIVH